MELNNNFNNIEKNEKEVENEIQNKIENKKTDKNINNSKKKKNVILIIILVYTIIAFLVTSAAIVFHKNTGISIVDYIKSKLNKEDIVENVEIEKSDISKTIVKTSLSDKYYLNNLEIKEIEEEINENYIYETEEYRNYENRLRYVEISGLKSKKVEEKINKEIKSTARSLILKEELEDDNIKYINITAYVYGNFSDLLSISVDKYVSLKEENERGELQEFDTISLNYRLDTGEKLELKDLFTPDASIKNILAQNLYKSFALHYGMENMDSNDDFGEPDMDNVDYSKIENEILKIINGFNKANDVNFYFSPTYIHMELKDNFVSIPIFNHYEYINLFNLVHPEKSLYEKGNLKKVNYVFGDPYISNCEVFKKISDDIFLSIWWYGEIDENDEEYMTFKKTIDENLHKIKKVIEENENMEYNKNKKGKIYNLNYVYVSEEETSISGERMEVDLDDFDSKIEEIYGKASRREIEGDYYLSIFSEEIDDGKFYIRIEEENGKFILLQNKSFEDTYYGTDGTKRDINGNIIESNNDNDDNIFINTNEELPEVETDNSTDINKDKNTLQNNITNESNNTLTTQTNSVIPENTVQDDTSNQTSIKNTVEENSEKDLEVQNVTNQKMQNIG